MFKDNTTNDISEADLRDLVTYIKDSFQSSNFRGAYDASVNQYPTSGGSGTSGAIQAGDEWYFSVAGTIGGDLYPIGTIAKALINVPGTTAANWRLI